jgi:hypothetical protein
MRPHHSMVAYKKVLATRGMQIVFGNPINATVLGFAVRIAVLASIGCASGHTQSAAQPRTHPMHPQLYQSRQGLESNLHSAGIASIQIGAQCWQWVGHRCNGIRPTQGVLVTIRCLPHDEQSPGALLRPTVTAFVCRSFSVRLARVVPNASRTHSSQKSSPGFPVRNSVARSMWFCVLRR